MDPFKRDTFNIQGKSVWKIRVKGKLGHVVESIEYRYTWKSYIRFFNIIHISNHRKLIVGKPSFYETRTGSRWNEIKADREREREKGPRIPQILWIIPSLSCIITKRSSTHLRGIRYRNDYTRIINVPCTLKRYRSATSCSLLKRK